jgi:membrane protease YdiL (CAAX protease family)
MNISMLNDELYHFLSAISVASFGVICYYYIADSTFVKKFLNSNLGEVRFILFQRFLGVLIFGMIPLLILTLTGTQSIVDFGVTAPVKETGTWTVILSVVIIIINYINSRTPENLALYPQIREEIWSLQLLTLSTASWIVYLLSYEFLFRGFLLFSTLSLLGFWPAIILNTAIYSLVHLPKGIKETIGAIPFGILLCYLTVRTGSIWIAVATHIVMAVSNEWLSLRAHPQMFIKIYRK